MSSTILTNELDHLQKKFQAFHDETKQTCRFEAYLQELLTAKSIECFTKKYEDIHVKDESFTLKNINDRLVKSLDSLKTTAVFCIEAQIDQVMRKSRLTKQA